MFTFLYSSMEVNILKAFKENFNWNIRLQRTWLNLSNVLPNINFCSKISCLAGIFWLENLKVLINVLLVYNLLRKVLLSLHVKFFSTKLFFILDPMQTKVKSKKALKSASVFLKRPMMHYICPCWKVVMSQ